MLTVSLAKGALLSPFKRPGPDRSPPAVRVSAAGVHVDARRLAAYKEVCAFTAGPAGLPVTYPQVLAFPLAMRLMARGDFPLPALGLVHTSITIRQMRPLSPHEAYGLTVYAPELTPHRRGTQARLVTELRVGGGEPVWESQSTYLARHATAAQDPGTLPAGGAASGADAAQELPVRAEWRLGGDLGRRYGAASGDRNPIHLHPLAARLFGFPRAIAHGMWSVARCLAAHGGTGTARAVREGPVTVRAEFVRPVLLPTTVRYAAEGERFALRGGQDGERVHLVGEVTR